MINETIRRTFHIGLADRRRDQSTTTTTADRSAEAGHDDRAHGRIVLQVEHGAPEFVGRRSVEGVENRRTVDRDDRDSAVALEQEVVNVHGS